MKSCSEFTPLLRERLAGEIAPPEADRLDEHLGHCSGCARELESLQEIVALASPTPPSPDEVRTVRLLPTLVLRALPGAEVPAGLPLKRALLATLALGMCAGALLFGALRPAPEATVPFELGSWSAEGSGLSFGPDDEELDAVALEIDWEIEEGG